MKIYAELTENIWNRKNCGIKSLQVNKLFHIHLGYPHNNQDVSVELVKYLDCYLGVPSIVEDPDIKRRSLYGKAGAFRLQDWGVEYRSLSSYMMRNEESLRRVWNGIRRAIHAFNEGYNRPAESDVISCINKSNVNLAKELIKEYNLEYKIDD